MIQTNRIHNKSPYALRPNMTVKEKFEDNIFYSPDGCWYWLGSTFGNPPRARMYIVKKAVTGARIAYQLYNGNIGEMFVLHTCDNPLCVNPHHLYLGTTQDNSNDRMLRSTKKGHQSPKLNTEDIGRIRESADSCVSLARKFGVTAQTISNIKNGKSWKHLQMTLNSKGV